MAYDKKRLQAFAEFHAKKYWMKARRMWGDKVGVMPTIEMNARLTATAGRAWLEEGKCDFSCYLMERNENYFAEDTIPHELAHIIAFRLYKEEGHGTAWKKVAMDLYGKNNRCHTMGTKAIHERNAK